jgi:hypothetical protein
MVVAIGISTDTKFLHPENANGLIIVAIGKVAVIMPVHDCIEPSSSPVTAGKLTDDKALQDANAP